MLQHYIRPTVHQNHTVLLTAQYVNAVPVSIHTDVEIQLWTATILNHSSSMKTMLV